MLDLRTNVSCVNLYTLYIHYIYNIHIYISQVHQDARRINFRS